MWPVSQEGGGGVKGGGVKEGGVKGGGVSSHLACRV